MTIEYGHFYDENVQFIANGDDIVFASNGPSTANIAHTPVEDEITVNETGVYRISFTASSIEPSQLGVTVNDSVGPGSAFGSGSVTQQNTGETLLSLTAGDIVTLRNITGSVITLSNTEGGVSTNVSAGITVEQVG